ncbi:transcription antitermination factor NusB [Candidatus Woesebacteria bacterium]|nr:MAG: transcription antitermination factor NusB [Candidatus Woesebacteria bacterium]
MKTSKDPRHKQRVDVVKQLFAQSFTQQPHSEKLVDKILENQHVLDAKISQAAPAWPLDKLNRVDLVILRLAVYELDFTSTPPKVIIDEAVELAKQFGSEKSPSFINGVLGTIYHKEE